MPQPRKKSKQVGKNPDLSSASGTLFLLTRLKEIKCMSELYACTICIVIYDICLVHGMERPQNLLKKNSSI